MFKEFLASAETSLGIVLSHALSFKEPLNDYTTKAAGGWIDSSRVPPGEIWEVTGIFANTDGVAGDASLETRQAAGAYIFDQKANATWLSWGGHIWLVEGQWIRALMQIGALRLYLLGVKRYTRNALVELLRAMRSIEPEIDVQAARVRPDPVM